tara:strand:+ start:65 stop:664 length:600 start_codon:yes stop_codon:yes gene_type:complete
MLIKIHRFLGISLVFFILVLSVTGTLIQHAEIFNIRNNYAPSSIAKNFYDIQPCKIYSYQFNKKWISICNQDLYFDIKKVASNVEKVTSIFIDNNKYHIHYDNHVIIINPDSSISAMDHIEPEDSKITLKEGLIPTKQKKIIEDKSISKTITYERIAVDLHSGRLFGSFGVTLIDLVTIGIIILSFTGAYSWIRHKKIF